MMRVLRLYAPSLIGDHTLCYVSTNIDGNTCVNDVETPLLWARAGEPLDGEEHRSALTIVLPLQAKLNEGDFLSVGKGGQTLLRWQNGRFCVCRAGFVGVSEQAEIWPPIRTAVLAISDKGREASVKTLRGRACAPCFHAWLR